MKTHTFEITIDDGYDAYRYPIDIGEDQSIYDIYLKLCKVYRVKPQSVINGSSVSIDPNSVQTNIPDFSKIIDDMAWHSTDTQDGQFRRMERKGKVKMYHKHGETWQEMSYSKKTCLWTCKCGGKI